MDHAPPAPPPSPVQSPAPTSGATFVLSPGSMWATAVNAEDQRLMVLTEEFPSGLAAVVHEFKMELEKYKKRQLPDAALEQIKAKRVFHVAILDEIKQKKASLVTVLDELHENKAPCDVILKQLL